MKCSECHGKGGYEQSTRSWTGDDYDTQWDVCYRCNGSGNEPEDE